MDTLRKLETAFGLQLGQAQTRQVRLYLELLERWNRRFNLTAVKGVQDSLQLHFFEAFWAARQFLEPAARVAEAGAGAGFPGLAMKIHRPDLQIALLEKNHKKIVFLEEAGRRLGLKVTLFHGRAEAFPGWPGIQVVLLRAVTPSPGLLERLAVHRLQLLLFHGEQPGDWSARLSLLRKLPVPGSRNRCVSLFQC